MALDQKMLEQRKRRLAIRERYLRMFPCRRIVDYHFLRFKHIDHRMTIEQREAMW